LHRLLSHPIICSRVERSAQRNFRYARRTRVAERDLVAVAVARFFRVDDGRDRSLVVVVGIPFRALGFIFFSFAGGVVSEPGPGAPRLLSGFLPGRSQPERWRGPRWCCGCRGGAESDAGWAGPADDDDVGEGVFDLDRGWVEGGGLVADGLVEDVDVSFDLPWWIALGLDLD